MPHYPKAGSAEDNAWRDQEAKWREKTPLEEWENYEKASHRTKTPVRLRQVLVALFKEKQGNFVFKAVTRLLGGGENVLEKILEAF